MYLFLRVPRHWKFVTLTKWKLLRKLGVLWIHDENNDDNDDDNVSSMRLRDCSCLNQTPAHLGYLPSPPYPSSTPLNTFDSLSKSSWQFILSYPSSHSVISAIVRLNVRVHSYNGCNTAGNISHTIFTQSMEMLELVAGQRPRVLHEALNRCSGRQRKQSHKDVYTIVPTLLWCLGPLQGECLRLWVYICSFCKVRGVYTWVLF